MAKQKANQGIFPLTSWVHAIMWFNRFWCFMWLKKKYFFIGLVHLERRTWNQRRGDKRHIVFALDCLPLSFPTSFFSFVTLTTRCVPKSKEGVDDRWYLVLQFAGNFTCLHVRLYVLLFTRLPFFPCILLNESPGRRQEVVRKERNTAKKKDKRSKPEGGESIKYDRKRAK